MEETDHAEIVTLEEAGKAEGDEEDQELILIYITIICFVVLTHRKSL